MGKIIGIDLGTSTSEVAYLDDGVAKIIKNINEDNSFVIPSVVSIEEEEIKVGIKARNKMILAAENTVSEVKRIIGTEEKIEIKGKLWRAEEISALIIKKLKDVAEFFLAEDISEAVITVPANFNEKERRATKDAAEIAGLKVERIINEPTAAALAYGINNLSEDSKILVYDLGGGTFDVTILELFDGIIDVKASRGNNRLGGKDIDNIILDIIVEKFKEREGFSLDLKNKRIKASLSLAAKEGKENLSFDKEVEIVVPYLTIDENNNPVDLDIKITRECFEKRIAKIIDGTIEIVDEALKASKLSYEDIDKVILVGGSTRIPYVRKVINSYFKDKIVSGINPDEVVALGAAIQGGIKSGEIECSDSILITDASSHSLGVEILGGDFDPIIIRDSKLPIVVKKAYKTVEDNQSTVEIRVYEGESDKVVENNFIGSFELGGIPKGKKGAEIIEISFSYDLNGILDISAIIISNGKSATKKIAITGLSKEDIKKMESNLGEFKEKNKVEENKEEESEKVEIKKEESNIEEKEKEEEEYSPEEFYNDVARLVNYYNYRAPNLEEGVKKEAGDLLQDLLASVKSADPKKGKKIADRIIELIYEEEN